MPALGSAYGLGIASREPVPGLESAGGVAHVASLRLTVAPEAEAPALPVGEELFSRAGPDGEVLAAVSRAGDGRYGIYGAGLGSYEVSSDASEVSCRPAADCPPWVWQRFLMSQALPLAATLHGIEPFHAGAVLVDGRVVAFAGTSGAGKSSLALSLATRGLPFYADDVLAVTGSDGAVLCHAGPGAANVRDAGLRRLALGVRPPFHGVLGESADGVRTLVRRDEGSRPLGAIYFLDHGPEHRRVLFEPTRDPRMLLGHTFNVTVQTRERLARQLALCSAMAEQAALFRLRVPAGTPVRELAERIEEHARGRSQTRTFFAT